MKNLALCRKCEHLEVTNESGFWFDDEDWRRTERITNNRTYSCKAPVKDEDMKDQTYWSISSCSYDNKKEFRAEDPPEHCPYKLEHMVLGKRTRV